MISRPTWMIASVCMLFSSSGYAADSSGITFRLSLLPDVQSIDNSEDEVETTTTSSDSETERSQATEKGGINQTLFSLGLGYTTGFGLHLGASATQDQTNYKVVVNESDPDSGRSFKYTVKAKNTVTTLGPTLGYIHAKGFSAFVTPFVSVSSKSEESFEFDSSTSSGSTDEDPVVKDNSKTSGFRFELAYHFRMGPVSIGPELTYTALTTKVDITTTERDTNRNNEVEVIESKQTGTIRTTRLVPMIGMAVFL